MSETITPIVIPLEEAKTFDKTKISSLRVNEVAGKLILSAKIDIYRDISEDEVEVLRSVDLRIADLAALGQQNPGVAGLVAAVKDAVIALAKAHGKLI